MPRLLHVDSSPLYGESVSPQLTNAFIPPRWEVIDRDLNATAISPITAEWVGAAFRPEEARTHRQTGLLALSDQVARRARRLPAWTDSRRG